MRVQLVVGDSGAGAALASGAYEAVMVRIVVTVDAEAVFLERMSDGTGAREVSTVVLLAAGGVVVPLPGVFCPLPVGHWKPGKPPWAPAPSPRRLLVGVSSEAVSVEAASAAIVLSSADAVVGAAVEDIAVVESTAVLDAAVVKVTRTEEVVELLLPLLLFPPGHLKPPMGPSGAPPVGVGAAEAEAVASTPVLDANSVVEDKTSDGRMAEYSVVNVAGGAIEDVEEAPSVVEMISEGAMPEYSAEYVAGGAIADVGIVPLIGVGRGA